MKATRFELLAALVLGLAVSACAAEAPKSSKDTLMYGVNAEAASLDPSTSKDTVTHMMMLQICLRITGSRPSTGSSKIISSGFAQIASQKATCFCIPFDRRRILLFTSIFGKNS